VEVSALTHARTAPGLRGPSPLLRLQSDERLVALTRRGQHAAFETLCARYQSRLLSFVRHMLGSREDAEDVLQEVFAAAFNAVLADEREINVRPWLYRIARNRSLNHLRRACAVGMDSMDVHFADHGLSTGDRVLRRESFRELLADVQRLPETQRTALLLREIDALSYEHIAGAMETTVPSVKSLLVRARISLAEAAEARKLSCHEVRLELGEAAEGLVSVSSPARRHVRDCDRCRSFKRQLKQNNHALAAIFPVGPVLLLKSLLLTKLGSSASASSAHVASGAGVTLGAGAAAGAGAVGGAGAGGVLTVGAGALATKAVAGLAAAAIVSAGAVAANQAAHHHRAVAHARVAYVPAERQTYEPVVASERAQPLSSAYDHPALPASHRSRPHRASAKLAPATAKNPAIPAAPTGTTGPTGASGLPAPTKAAPGQASPAPVTQLTSETTQLPAAATSAPQPAAAPAGAAPQGSAPPAKQPSPAAPAPGSPPPSAAAPASSAQPAPAATRSSAPATPASQAGPSSAPVKTSVHPHRPAARRHVGAQRHASAPPRAAARGATPPARRADLGAGARGRASSPS
jgi:RNA polymerase sigma factor (sigma-70 family)